MFIVKIFHQKLFLRKKLIFIIIIQKKFLLFKKRLYNPIENKKAIQYTHHSKNNDPILYQKYLLKIKNNW